MTNYCYNLDLELYFKNLKILAYDSKDQNLNLDSFPNIEKLKISAYNKEDALSIDLPLKLTINLKKLRQI